MTSEKLEEWWWSSKSKVKSKTKREREQAILAAYSQARAGRVSTGGQ